MSFILNMLRRKPEPLNLPPRVIHWIRQAPTFTLLDTDDEALALASSLDGIIQGREHIQAHILLLRDRVAQDQARIIELESLMNETSRATLKREESGSDQTNGSSAEVRARSSDVSATRGGTKASVTSNARETYTPEPSSATTHPAMAPLPRRETLKLADAGEALTRAVRGM